MDTAPDTPITGEEELDTDTASLPDSPAPLDIDTDPPVDTTPPDVIDTVPLLLLRPLESPKRSDTSSDEELADASLHTTAEPLDPVVALLLPLVTDRSPLRITPTPERTLTLLPMPAVLAPPTNVASPPTAAPDALLATPPDKDRQPTAPIDALSEPRVTATPAPPTAPSELAPAPITIVLPSATARAPELRLTMPSEPDDNSTEPLRPDDEPPAIVTEPASDDPDAPLDSNTDPLDP